MNTELVVPGMVVRARDGGRLGRIIKKTPQGFIVARGVILRRQFEASYDAIAELTDDGLVIDDALMHPVTLPARVPRTAAPPPARAAPAPRSTPARARRSGPWDERLSGIGDPVSPRSSAGTAGIGARDALRAPSPNEAARTSSPSGGRAKSGDQRRSASADSVAAATTTPGGSQRGQPL